MIEELDSTVITEEELSEEELSEVDSSFEEEESEVSSGGNEVYNITYTSLTEEQASQLSNINATVTFGVALFGVIFIIWLFDFVVKKINHYTG